MKKILLLVFTLATVVACSREQAPQPTVQTTQATADPEAKKLESMAARFAPVDLTADVAALPANERQVLTKLVQAAKVFDALFLRQVWEGNESMLLDLARDAAHGVARPAAPLTTFLVGYAAGLAGGSRAELDRAVATATALATADPA